MKTDLKAHLKNLLDSDRERRTARAIESLSAESLGDDHFAFDDHGVKTARILATIDEDVLLKFIDGVLTIRKDKAAEYFMATKHLIGDDNE